MALAISLLIGVMIGTGIAFQSLHYAHRDDFVRANTRLRTGALIGGSVAMLCISWQLGWPWLSRTESVSEEVTQTIVETVQVPVQVTHWFFWTKTVKEAREVPKNVTVTVQRPVQTLRFSFWMVLPWLLVGWTTSSLVQRLVRLGWRWGFGA